MHLHPFLEELVIDDYAHWKSMLDDIGPCTVSSHVLLVTVFIKTNGYTDLVPSVISVWNFLDFLIKEPGFVLDGVFASSLFTFWFSYFIRGGAQVFASSPNWHFNTCILNNSPRCSVAMFLDHIFQYYFIGDLWQKRGKNPLLDSRRIMQEEVKLM